MLKVPSLASKHYVTILNRYRLYSACQNCQRAVSLQIAAAVLKNHCLSYCANNNYPIHIIFYFTFSYVTVVVRFCFLLSSCSVSLGHFHCCLNACEELEPGGHQRLCVGFKESGFIVCGDMLCQVILCVMCERSIMSTIVVVLSYRFYF